MWHLLHYAAVAQPRSLKVKRRERETNSIDPKEPQQSSTNYTRGHPPTLRSSLKRSSTNHNQSYLKYINYYEGGDPLFILSSLDKNSLAKEILL